MRILGLLSILLVIVACTPETNNGRIIEVTLAPTETPAMIFVTPTSNPTAIPTIAIASETPTMTPTLTLTPTPDVIAQQAQCESILANLYSQASDLCLGSPSGFFCNAGLPPVTDPGGAIASSLGVPGALVEAELLTSVQTSPLNTNNSGGVMWLHLEDRTRMNALMLGDVTVKNSTDPNSGLQPWQSFIVETAPSQLACDGIPYNSLVVQGAYGIETDIVINGVSIALTGSLVIQTIEQSTTFMMIEGLATLSVLGRNYQVFAGQQISVPYDNGNFGFPANIAEGVTPLLRTRIADIPVMLLDRPVLIPQPGYAFTQGNVNMRAKPDIESRLLYQVPPETNLSILGQNTEGTWYHVRLGNGETGWIRGDLLVTSLGLIDASYDLTPEPPQRLGDLGKNATVISAQGGNLRSAPDTSFGVITTLAQGTEVELIGRSSYSPWVKVDAGGTVGWMALITLETRSAIGFLPIDYTAPLPVARPTSVPILNFGGGHAYPDPSGGQ